MKFTPYCVAKCFVLFFVLCYLPSSGRDKKKSKSDIENAQSPLEILQEGNNRFVKGKSIHPRQDHKTVKKLVAGQNPKAVIIGCSDSRVSPEIIFDQGLGDLFTIRTAGNVMGDYEEGSIEYAVEHLHTKLIIVMGHQSCGAIHALIEYHHQNQHQHDSTVHKDEHIANHITSILNKMNSEEEEKEALNATEDTFNKAVRANVVHGVKQLRTSQPVLSKEYGTGELKIVGAIYNIESGKVEFLDL